MPFKKKTAVFRLLESVFNEYFDTFGDNLEAAFYSISFFLLKAFEHTLDELKAFEHTLDELMQRINIGVNLRTNRCGFESIYEEIKIQLQNLGTTPEDLQANLIDLTHKLPEGLKITFNEDSARRVKSQSAEHLNLTPKIFSDIYEMIYLPKKQKTKKTGSFYTPASVASSLVKKITEFIPTTDDVDAESRRFKILDPACGAGEFLVASCRILIDDEAFDACDQSSLEDFSMRKKIVEDCIHGIDILPMAILSAKIRLLLWIYQPLFERITDDVDANILKTQTADINFKIFQGNYYDYEYDRILDMFNLSYFDLIVGNPPFNASFTNEMKRKLYPKYKGFIKNSAALFILKAHSECDQRTLIGFIMPKSIAYSKTWRTTKNRLLKDLIYVEDLSKAFQHVKLEQIVMILRGGIEKDSRQPTAQTISIPKPKNLPLHEGYYTRSSGGRTQEDSFIVHRKHSYGAKSLILGVSEKEYRMMERICKRIKTRLADYVEANRGLNLQKLAIRELGRINTKKLVSCFGGARISKYGLKPAVRYIPIEKIEDDMEKMNLLKNRNWIIGQLANAHVKNPIPHYKLAFFAPKNGACTDMLSFDTVINIKPKPMVDKYYLLCYLNSSTLAWYLYKFVYASAIRSTRLDAIYLNAAIYRPLHSVSVKHQKLSTIFEALAKTLITLKQSKIYQIVPDIFSTRYIPVKQLSDDLIFIIYFTEQINSLIDGIPDALTEELRGLNDEWQKSFSSRLLGEIALVKNGEEKKSMETERISNSELMNSLTERYTSSLYHIKAILEADFSEFRSDDQYKVIQGPFYK